MGPVGNEDVLAALYNRKDDDDETLDHGRDRIPRRPAGPDRLRRAGGACPGQLPSLGVRPLGNHSHLYYFEYIEQVRYIRYCSTDRGHRRRDRRGSLLV